MYKVTGLLTPDIIIDKMLSSRENWKLVDRMITDIMKGKESEEYERQVRMTT